MIRQGFQMLELRIVDSCGLLDRYKLRMSEVLSHSACYDMAQASDIPNFEKSCLPPPSTPAMPR